ncbi:MAG: hypothetical protein JWN73_3491 [Betaproteobacteria bacterium]|nr:hypothetical protein [Betaproteobacteria bacterium]
MRCFHGMPEFANDTSFYSPRRTPAIELPYDCVRKYISARRATVVENVTKRTDDSRRDLE